MYEFKIHEIDWTEEKIGRFWDWISEWESFQDAYFSERLGDSLLDFVFKYIPASGRILDFGCGKGYLLGKLLDRGISCEGLDSSSHSVTICNKKFIKKKLFNGVKPISSIPQFIDTETTFDTIFFIETIEHILPKNLIPSIKLLYKICRHDGYLVITVPNDENLKANNIMCPDCGCLFHTWQHVSSWNSLKLSSLMERVGFATVVCQAVTLKKKSKLNIFREIKSRILKDKPQHLIYIGKKK